MNRRDERNAQVRALYDGALAPSALAATLQRSESLFPTARVARAEAVRALPLGRRLDDIRVDTPQRAYDLVDCLALNRIAGLLVLHRGAIVREDYELGLTAQGRHASFSLAKSICSTLVGCALTDGLINHLQTPLRHWLPRLQRSAYADVPLDALLAMRSGVAWDETYTHAGSDRRRFLEAQLEERPGGLLEVMASLPRRADGARPFNYSTGETFLVGAVLEAVTGGSLPAYLSQRLWQPLGMQSDAHWWLESDGGTCIGGSGLAASLRDYGRFAQCVLEDGCVGTTRLVPPGWFRQATTSPDGERYGYQWWLPESADPVHAGAFLGMGIFGQRLYVHPTKQVAIVQLAARPKPSLSHVVADEAVFAAIAAAL